MRTAIVLLGLMFCLAFVQARHYTDRTENGKDSSDELTETISSLRDYRSSQMRHRRKRWQMNYGYDYPQPSNPYYPDRRDYDRNQELIPQILRLLDEIATYVKRPPPPPIPQPIYVPYPVPYPVPQNCTCNIRVSNTPNVSSRFPDLEDSNQNWGLVDDNENVEEDDGTDGARPISFDPIKPKRPLQRVPPAVEHGSTQAASNVALTQAPRNERTPTKSAGMCNAAILSCCSDENRKACFTRMGCSMTFTRGNACSPGSIAAAIDSFKVAYAPV